MKNLFSLSILTILISGCSNISEFYLNDAVVVTSGFYKGMRGVVIDKCAGNGFMEQGYLVHFDYRADYRTECIGEFDLKLASAHPSIFVEQKDGSFLKCDAHVENCVPVE